MHKLTKVFLVGINIFIILIELWQIFVAGCQYPSYEVFKAIAAGVSALVFAHAEIDSGTPPWEGGSYAN